MYGDSDSPAGSADVRDYPINLGTDDPVPVQKIARPDNALPSSLPMANTHDYTVHGDREEDSIANTASAETAAENDITSPNQMFREPAYRLPSQMQLAVESQAIYSGFSMIEHKCIEVARDLEGAAEAGTEEGSSPNSTADDSTAILDSRAHPGSASDSSITDATHADERPHAAIDEIEENAARVQLQRLEDPRRLEDKDLYKRISDQYFLLADETRFQSLTPNQYKATNDLNHTLVEEYFDLILVSLHPCALLQLRDFTQDQDIQERVWQCCISHLDMLRSRLPESAEHLHASIFYLYGVFTCLQELHGADRQVWIEALGDLARFRMTVDNEPDCWQNWKIITEMQYSHALGIDATIDSLRHHLGSVQPPDCTYVQQLLSHLKSFGDNNSHPLDRDSILAAMKATTDAILDEVDGISTCHQAVGISLERRPGTVLQKHTIRPSAELGLILCQLLLGTLVKGETGSPMMAAWASDSMDTTDPRTSPKNGRLSIDSTTHQAAQLLSAIVVRILSKPDTSDLRLCEFIHILLVFMRALNSRPRWKRRLEYAFHPELMAPLLDVLLHQAQIRGGNDWEKLFQSEFPVMYSPLNKPHKADVYGSRPDHARREGLTGDSAGDDFSKPVARDVAPGDFEADEVHERQFTCPLPEDDLLQGFPALATHVLRTIKPSSALAGGGARMETDTTAAENASLGTRPGPKKAKGGNRVDCEEVETAHYYPCLFPKGWFEHSKYDMEERHVRREFVQDIDTVRYRETRILWLLMSLLMNGPLHQVADTSNNGATGSFSSRQSADGFYHVGSPEGNTTPGSDLDVRMPQVVERYGGEKFVYVDPSLHVRVTKTDAFWQKHVESAEADDKIFTDTASRRLDFNSGSTEDQNQTTYIPGQQSAKGWASRTDSRTTQSGSARQTIIPCMASNDHGITSAWDLEVYRGNGKNVKEAGEPANGVEEGAATGTVKPISLSQTVLEQLSLTFEAAEVRQDQRGSKTMVESGMSEKTDSDGWTIVSKENTRSTDCKRPNKSWFSLTAMACVDSPTNPFHGEL